MLRRLFLTHLLLVAACGRGPSGDPASDTGTDQPAAAVFLVLQKLGNSVAFYTSDGTLLETVTVGTNPHEMIVSADGRYAYVTDYGALGVEMEAEGGTTVSVIDIASRALAGTIDLGAFRRPHGIDIDRHTGHLLVATENPDRLLVIDPTDGQILADFETRGITSHMVTLSPLGSMAFVSNVRTNDVSLIDLESGDVTSVAVGERPEGSAVTADGRTLFVACRESNIIAIIDTELGIVVGEIPTGRGPNRVRLTPDERLVVYPLVHDGQIGMANVASHQQIATVDLRATPVSLQLSADGKSALTASQDGDRVFVISIDERRITKEFSTSQGAGPDPVLDIVPP